MDTPEMLHMLIAKLPGGLIDETEMFRQPEKDAFVNLIFKISSSL